MFSVPATSPIRSSPSWFCANATTGRGRPPPVGDPFISGPMGSPASTPLFSQSTPSTRRVWATEGMRLLSKSPLPFHLVPIAAVNGRVTSGIRFPSLALPLLAPCAGPPFAAPLVIVAATPSPLPRPGAGCQRLLSMIGSSASATANLPAPPRASTKTRFRRWAKPKCWASKIRQAAHLVGPSTTPALVHPPAGSGMGDVRPTKPPKKAPKALSLVLRTPGTFSQRIQAGSLPAVDRRWSIASARSTN